jgi:hypothetical protein
MNLASVCGVRSVTLMCLKVSKNVAQMFSFLETVRLQGGEAIAQLYKLLSLAGRSPPGLQLDCTFR